MSWHTQWNRLKAETVDGSRPSIRDLQGLVAMLQAEIDSQRREVADVERSGHRYSPVLPWRYFERTQRGNFYALTNAELPL